MRLAIMQPYFFPYLGYFQLIHTADRFILFDDVQYIRHGWINRNRTQKPGGGWQYIVAPLQKHQQSDPIKNMSYQGGDEWKTKILRQLEHYRKKAAYYTETMNLLHSCFETNETNVTMFNARILELVCEAVKIPFRTEVSSRMNFDYSDVKNPGEWALRISEQLRAEEYINPPGGKELFDDEKFRKSGIKLSFLQPVLLPYDQKQEPFEPGLSIIDVLMFNGTAGTREMITNTGNTTENQ